MIDKRIVESRNTHQQGNRADDLEKYAQLRDKGILTEEEFNKKKKQLLGDL